MQKKPMNRKIFSLFVFAILLSSSVAMAQRGYVRSDGINSVVYNGIETGFHIYELFLLADGWHLGDLTAQAGAPIAHSEAAPYVRSDNVNSVVYLGTNNHIYELFLGARTGRWSFQDLTAQAGAPLAHSEVAPYVRSENVNSVVYRGANNHIYELFFSARIGRWSFQDLTILANAPTAYSASAPAAYVRSDGVNAVVYVGSAAEFHIYELSNSGDGWQVDDLTAQTDAPTPVSFARLAPYVSSDGVNSIVYNQASIDSYHYICELFLLDDGWHVRNLTSEAGAPLAVSDPAPYVRSDNFNSVVYKGQYGSEFHIYEIFFTPRSRPGLGDLTNYAGAEPADPYARRPGPYVRSDNFNSVIYRGDDGHIYEFFLSGDGWYAGDLTYYAGG